MKNVYSIIKIFSNVLFSDAPKSQAGNSTSRLMYCTTNKVNHSPKKRLMNGKEAVILKFNFMSKVSAPYYVGLYSCNRCHKLKNVQ
jgi:hypothetical protein